MIKDKQMNDFPGSKLIQETDAKLMTDNEALLIANLVAKGAYGCRVYNVTTASLSLPQTATRDFRTAVQTYTFPQALANAPVAVIGVVNSDLGAYTVNVLTKTTTGITYKVNTSIANTARAFNLTFIVLY